ncbi:MAG: hypothetical protein WC843_04130 [Candidatus Gracilibacteria bacterium]|jgi:hypothetical protein
MVKEPKISTAFEKKHAGQVTISLNGKIIGMGKNAIFALRNAKKKMPNIEKKEFLVSRIHSQYIAI